MTMDPDDFSLDELASAYLDNEATPDERAVALASPDVIARADDFARVRGLLAGDLDAELSTGLDTVADGSIASPEDFIARAMGAFDELHGQSEAATPSSLSSSESSAVTAKPTPPVVANLAARRSRRSGRTWSWLAAAAAVVGGLFLVGRSLSSIDSKSTSARSESSTAGAAATTAAASPAAATAAPSLTDAALQPKLAATEVPGAPSTDAAASVADAAASTAAPSATDAAATTVAGAIDGGGDAGPAGQAVSAAPMTFNTNEQLQSYVLALVRSGAPARAVSTTAPGCGVAGEFIEQVIWQGAYGQLFLLPDRVAPSSVTIVDDSCVVLVSIPVAP